MEGAADQLICRHWFVNGQVKAAPVLCRGGLRLIGAVGVVAVVGTTAVQTDMRGLGTAGRWFGANGSRLSRHERHVAGVDLVVLIVVSRVCSPTSPSTGCAPIKSIWPAVTRGWPATSTSRPVRGRWRRWRLRVFLAQVERDPAFVQAPVAGVAARRRRRGRLPTGRAWSCRAVGGRWCQAASTSRRRAWVLPVLVIEPCTREAPEECSEGTSPTNEPMRLPVNRSSHRSRPPGQARSASRRRAGSPAGALGLNSLSRGHLRDPLSSRSRRAVTISTASNGGRTQLWYGRCRSAADAATHRAARSRRSRRSTRSLAQQQFGQPVPGPHQITAAVFTGAHQIPCRLLVDARARRPRVISPRRSSRARCTASLASVLTRSPRAVQLRRRRHHTPIPAAVSARSKPNPVGPAS